MSIQSRIKQSRFESVAVQAVISLQVAAGLVQQRGSELCKQHGITADQYNVLRILRGVHPGGHPRYEIANRLMNRAPDVTRLIDRLERQGLVERGWDEGNRRLSIARITPAGLALLAELDPQILALEEGVTAGLSSEELQAFIRVCEHIAR